MQTQGFLISCFSTDIVTVNYVIPLSASRNVTLKREKEVYLRIVIEDKTLTLSITLTLTHPRDLRSPLPLLNYEPPNTPHTHTHTGFHLLGNK